MLGTYGFQPRTRISFGRKGTSSDALLVDVIVVTDRLLPTQAICSSGTARVPGPGPGVFKSLTAIDCAPPNQSLVISPESASIAAGAMLCMGHQIFPDDRTRARDPRAQEADENFHYLWARSPIDRLHANATRNDVQGTAGSCNGTLLVAPHGMTAGRRCAPHGDGRWHRIELLFSSSPCAAVRHVRQQVFFFCLERADGVASISFLFRCHRAVQQEAHFPFHPIY